MATLSVCVFVCMDDAETIGLYILLCDWSVRGLCSPMQNRNRIIFTHNEPHIHSIYTLCNRLCFMSYVYHVFVVVGAYVPDECMLTSIGIKQTHLLTFIILRDRHNQIFTILIAHST